MDIRKIGSRSARRSRNPRATAKPFGARLDSTHGSTGQSHINEIDRESGKPLASVSPRHIGHIGPVRSEVVGHAPDGSGRILKTTHDRGLIGNAIQTHAPLQPQGMNHSATGGKSGKQSKVPVGKTERAIGTSLMPVRLRVIRAVDVPHIPAAAAR